MNTRLRTRVKTLGVLARADELNQVILVERSIDEYLNANADHRAHALERLRNVIHKEEAANRPGEDWSVARNYFRRLLHNMLRADPESC
jgi:hypothetical protein